MVRELFDLYLQHRSVIRRGAGWSTIAAGPPRPRSTKERGPQGEVWRGTRPRCTDILANVTTSEGLPQRALYPGEQDAIVDKRCVPRAGRNSSSTNSQNGGSDTRNKHGALLKGLLRADTAGRRWLTPLPRRATVSTHYMCRDQDEAGQGCLSHSVTTGARDRGLRGQRDPEAGQGS